MNKIAELRKEKLISQEKVSGTSWFIAHLYF